MAIYGLHEGLIKDLKSQLGDLRDKYNKEKEKKIKPTKVAFTDEQMKEIKSVEEEIHAIATKIVDKYAKNSQMKKKLHDAIIYDLSHSDADINIDEYMEDVVPEFYYFENISPDCMTIWVIDESVDNMIWYYFEYSGDIKNSFPKTNAIVNEVYDSIIKEISSKIDKSNLNIHFYTIVGEKLCGDGLGLEIHFLPKKG